MTSSTDPHSLPPARRRTGRGLVTGLIAALVALGVGQLVAGITSPQAAPVIAVGDSAIDLTPPPLKNFAISEFGSNDKTVLQAGILVLLLVFAALIGVAAMRRLAYGLAGLGVFTAIGLIAALTRPTAGPSYAIPVLIGGAAAALTMILLVRAANADAGVTRPALDSAADDLGWLGQGTGAPELPADAAPPEPTCTSAASARS